jgi:hypothetical protein
LNRRGAPRPGWAAWGNEVEAFATQGRSRLIFRARGGVVRLMYTLLMGSGR